MRIVPNPLQESQPMTQDELKTLVGQAALKQKIDSVRRCGKTACAG